MRVLVTGATGFVGACLARRMVSSGYDVHIFTRKQSNRWRIADLSKSITNHEVDLCDSDNVDKAIKDIRPNIVYHLATYGGFAFQQDTRNIMQSNLMGTINLLQSCEAIGFDYFVNTGSSSEYGLKESPMKEEDITAPIGDYGVSKVAATLFCQSEAVRKSMPIVTLRLFSPYGNWDDPKRLIPYVIKSLLREEVPQLSTPTSVRDYVYIKDILDFYQMIVNQPLAAGNIYNVGSGIQQSIGSIVTTITKIIGNGIEPIWGAIEQKRPESSLWVADIAKARNTGLEVKVDLETGLQETISWMKENIDLYP
ncbi:MAG: NAD-dependent epimerase/dehydratase family protein [Pelosinus sp.]|nr:NAD-dependent epimerase/dehydratase family protein [Pelosinus sp.]